MDENGQVRPEQMRGLSQASARIKQLVSLVTDLNVESKVVILLQIVDNLIGEVMDIDNEMVEAGIPQLIDHALNKRHAAYRHHSFRHRVGKRLQAGSHARGKYHGLHHKAPNCIAPLTGFIIITDLVSLLAVSVVYFVHDGSPAPRCQTSY